MAKRLLSVDEMARGLRASESDFTTVDEMASALKEAACNCGGHANLEEDGDMDSDLDPSVMARFKEGPEGRKEFEKWLADQPEDFQAEWEDMNEEHRDKFRQARFKSGPEGRKEFEKWLADQPEDFQAEWDENTDKYKDKFKSAWLERRARFSEGEKGRKEFEKWMGNQPEGFQEEWAANTDEYKDKFKTARRQRLTRKQATMRDDTLEQLVDMDVESFGGDPERLEWTSAIDRAQAKWNDAVEKALLKWVRMPGNREKFDFSGRNFPRDAEPEDIVDVLMTIDGGAGFLYYMEMHGHGVGTWDGGWDHLFVDDDKTIKELSKYMEKTVRREKDALSEAIADAALASVPEDEDDYIDDSYKHNRYAKTRTAKAKKIRTAYIDMQTLDQLVDMAVETVGGDPARSDFTSSLKATNDKWNRAVEKALMKWLRDPKNWATLDMSAFPRDAEPEDVVDTMQREGGGAGYLYFMEMEGHGVGTWDGRWKHLFQGGGRKTIDELSKYMEKAVGREYQKLKDEIDDIAYGSVPEDEDDYIDDSYKSNRYASKGLEVQWDRLNAKQARGKTAAQYNITVAFPLMETDEEIRDLEKRVDKQMDRVFDASQVLLLDVSPIEGGFDIILHSEDESDLRKVVKGLRRIPEVTHVSVRNDDTGRRERMARRNKTASQYSLTVAFPLLDTDEELREQDERVDKEMERILDASDVLVLDVSPIEGGFDLILESENEKEIKKVVKALGRISEVTSVSARNDDTGKKVRAARRKQARYDTFTIAVDYDLGRGDEGHYRQILEDENLYIVSEDTHEEGTDFFVEIPRGEDDDMKQAVEVLRGARGVDSVTVFKGEHGKMLRMAGRPRGGLYGYRKSVQAACESGIRKLSKMAGRVAKTTIQKDPHAAAFLLTHSKRANSVPAKLLVAAMEDMGPKLLQRKTAASRVTVVPAYGRDYRSKAAVQADWDAGKDFLIQDVSSPWDGKYISKDDAKDAGIREVNVRFKRMRNVAVLRVAATRSAGRRNPRYGMYGFEAKTANLGLAACTSVKEAAGNIAADLHRRKAAQYRDITGFFQEHHKTAGCNYSGLLLGSYPDRDMKLGSQTRTAGDLDTIASFVDSLLNSGEEWEYLIWGTDREDTKWKVWGYGDGLYSASYEHPTTYTGWEQAVQMSDDTRDLVRALKRAGHRRMSWDRRTASSPSTVDEWLAWEG